MIWQVVTVTKFQGGGAFNVIPNAVTIGGTFRAFSKESFIPTQTTHRRGKFFDFVYFGVLLTPLFILTSSCCSLNYSSILYISHAKRSIIACKFIGICYSRYFGL